MREKLLFDFGWSFHSGDIAVPRPTGKMPTYCQAKTERAQYGPASYGYREDSYTCPDRWESVDLPHDYIISQAPEERGNCALGYFQYHSAWYRNRFRLEDADRDKRITILFEGIAGQATVYVNGCLMARNFCGYTSFEVDMTDVARIGQENTVAVYVDPSAHEGWWYEGAGIYRHVWLLKTEPVAVDLWGVWVNPQRTAADGWDVPVETTLRNDSLSPAKVDVKTAIVDKAGREIASRVDAAEIPIKDKVKLNQLLHVSEPELWDVGAPNLYTLHTVVSAGGKELDRTETRFGFRSIYFSAEKGFFLNGKNVKIKGVCCHQDYGLTGKAMPDRVHRFRLRRLKEMGANGYRASHYPPAEATMDALDELGFLVMDETRWFESTKEGLEQLAMMLKRDRNRPSVIMWSVGNEEPLHASEAGKRIFQTMQAFVRKYDPTRPVTTAVCHDPLHSPAAAASDVMGINYNLEHYDAIHEKYPLLPVIASECCAVGTTRGWYFDDDPARGFFAAWDHAVSCFSFSREETWKQLASRPWVAGGYQWAGIEHRGETVWPRLCSQSGALDLFLQPKDAYFQNLSHWTEQPMVHLLPHWNHPGREGEIIPVWAYTNCQEVELFQDGKSLGRQTPGKFGHGHWQVEYRPGTLTAKGFVDGKPAALQTVETTGPAVSLELRLEDDAIRADGEDIAIITCLCRDQQGRAVPDAAPFVRFSANRLGKIVGTGSDITDHVPVSCPDRRMRAGLCSVAVKAASQAGTLRVYAQAENLLPARLDIPLLAAPRRAWVRPVCAG